jgi:para-nitrobenzyl esterase
MMKTAALITVHSTLLALAFTGCVGADREATRSIAVQTSSGQVLAERVAEGALVYRDIPFAKPPIGPLRWAAPEPLENPEQAIRALPAPVMCPQPQSMASGIEGGDYHGSEDCLYLDIYSPGEAPSADPAPVMLWIHGGSNLTGHKGTYDFSRFAARQGVVVVVINYRLGPFGWFVHPAIQGPDLDTLPLANFGTLDMVEALRWTQRNIGHFGGDSNNVTIFGESAGGRNVYSLLASPLTGGLFHKAIAQSGHVRSFSPAQAYNANRAFAQMDRGSWDVVDALGLKNDQVDAETIRDVETLDLLRAYYELDDDHSQPAVINDGVVIPAAGLLPALGDPEYAKGIPVMAGTTRDEITLWLGLNRYYVDVSYPLTRLLPAKLRIKDPDLYEFWVDMRSRGWKLSAVDDPFSAMEQAGYTQLYAYRYDWDEQSDNFLVHFSEILGASHASEIAFIMGAPMYGAIGNFMYPDTASAREMTDTMMGAWGAFARDGEPALPRGLTWPRYDSAHPTFVTLDVGEALGVSDDVPDRDELLNRVAASAVVTELERCLLAWEMFTAVGDPDYGVYAQWQDGRCATVDAVAEKRRIQEDLKAKYGSVYYPE